MMNFISYIAMHIKKYIYAYLLLHYLTFPAPVKAWNGTIMDVVDGDTVTVAPAGQTDAPIRVRLYGIDAPEKAQLHGPESNKALQDLLDKGQEVQIVPLSEDRYGRVVGLVIAKDTTLNLEMVRQGKAWIYERYCKAFFCRQWRQVEKEAQSAARGLWNQPDAMPPWQWRKQRGKLSSKTHF